MPTEHSKEHEDGEQPGGSQKRGQGRRRVREVSGQAIEGTRQVGRDTGHRIRGAVASAIQAMSEVGGEAGAFVKDAVIVVIEGTGDIARTTAPEVRNAVEGAIRGAVTVGMSPEKAAEQAYQGVIEAVRNAEGDLGEAARATVGGVISGVAAAGGDVQKVAANLARGLINDAADAGENVSDVALGVMEGVMEVSEDAGAVAAETVYTVAREIIESAYSINERVGETVRSRVTHTITMHLSSLAPASQDRYAEVMHRLSEDLEVRRGRWRFRALWHAGRSLLSLGGLDLAASLAYFTLLSFFPVMALVILLFASFADTSTVRQYLSDILLFYFPASQDFLDAAIDHIFQARLQTGIVAVAGMILGANGLFMAVNRSVNRVFGTRPKRVVGATAMEVVLGVSVILIFMVALSLTVAFQVFVNLSEAFPSLGPLTTILVLAAEILSAILPFLLTILVFAIVYRTIPNRSVSWRDATYGGMVAVVLFELAKHLFFWFTTLSSQRSLLYGTISSVIILLIWSNVAGMIFLYGAALTRESARHRPRDREDNVGESAGVADSH